MSGYPAVYQPVVANPNDGENITLCKILDAVSTGSGGGVASANAAVGPDGVTRVPLNLNADGELKVNVDATVDADLTSIENKLDTIIGIETPQAADVAAIKTSLNNGISVNKDTSGSGSVTTSTPLVITTTNFGTLAFQSNAVATGTVTIEGSVDGTNYTATTYVALASGNTSSSFNAATATIGQIDTSGLRNIRFRSNTIVGTVGITYNLSANVSTFMLDNPLPAGTNVIGAVTANAGTNLNTSALALESGGNLATIATKMSDGLQTTKIVNGANTLAVDSAGALTANNAATQVYNYTATGAISPNTILIGPIDCSTFREFVVQPFIGVGASNPIAQFSNDGTNWQSAPTINHTGVIQSGTLPTASMSFVPLYGSKWFRIISQGTQTSGTTTLVAYASQQATPKLYQTVTLSGQAAFIPQPSPSNGFTTYHTLVSAASTNATSVKAAAGQIGTLILTNSSATWAYFKLINKASSPTVGTDTAVINIGVAPNTTLDCSSSFAGLRMTTGIAYYVSGGPSLTDNTALLAANTFLVNMTYV
jgi:hypothetical protein